MAPNVKHRLRRWSQKQDIELMVDDDNEAEGETSEAEDEMCEALSLRKWDQKPRRKSLKTTESRYEA